MRPVPRPARWALPLAAVVALAGCDGAKRDMVEQPRYAPGAGSPLFDDGLASRPPPPGSVPHARGDLAATSSGRLGTEAAEADARAAAQDRLPERPERALLLRGRERYTIYCVPCHSPLGDGDGRVVRRGFPAPPSYHLARLRAAPDRHFYDVITRGHGVMPAYGDRIGPEDRWAIVAYIRALQLSQHAPAARLPPELRERLAAARTPASAPGEGRP
jgi:mono/diheme cytochrome c family protein